MFENINVFLELFSLFFKGEIIIFKWGICITLPKLQDIK